MQMTEIYSAEPITRADVDALPGVTVLEFGAPWCGYCQIAQPMLAQAFESLPSLRHLKIEDGKDQALGRSFGVKLWPSLILMIDGIEISRLTRPNNPTIIAEMLARIPANATLSLTP